MPIKLHRDQFRWTNGRGHDQKPVLYSQKTNTYGLGKKEHNSDHWWAAAFDSQLKSLDVSNSTGGEVTVKQTQTAATPLGMSIVSKYSIKFVPGEVLTGSLERPGTEETVEKEEDRTTSKEKKKDRRSKRTSVRSSRESSTDRGKKKEKKRKATNKKRVGREERKKERRLRRLLEKEMASLHTVEV